MPESTSSATRSKIGNLSKQVKRAGSTPDMRRELVEARQELAERRIAEYVQAVLSKAPPLTDEQRARLASLISTPVP